MNPSTSAATAPVTIRAGTHHRNRRCSPISHGAIATTAR